MQGLMEPVATFKKWQSLGRIVNKGSKAKFIWMPIIRKDKVTKDDVFGGFFLKNCIFGLSETNGPDIPIPEIPNWNKDVALANLNINEVAFDYQDGNVQGFATVEGFAVNPIAVYPVKTMFHEIAHIVMGHINNKDGDRKIQEMQAECTSYILMYELELTDKFDADASRHYIQNWLGQNKPSDDDIKGVFKTVDAILKAGLPNKVETEFTS